MMCANAHDNFVFSVRFPDMMTDVMTDTAPPSLRDRQKAQTRELIFDGVMRVLESGELSDVSPASVGAAVSISERTVYRYFADRDALMDAFWPWFVEHLGLRHYSQSAEDLRLNPPKVFAVFDRHQNLIRALITSKQGRAVRDRGNRQRQDAWRRAVADAVGGPVPQEDERALLAAGYAIYSGYGWAAMHDFWGMGGEEAGRAAAQSLTWLFAGYRAARAASEPN